MGGGASFAAIEKKYGDTGVKYILSKYQQRNIYNRIEDQIKILKGKANESHQSDLDYIKTERQELLTQFNNAKDEAQKKKAGSIKEAEAKAKRKVEDFSGYNDQVKKIDKVQRETNEKYKKQIQKMEVKVRQHVQDYKGKTPNTSIPEYDDKPDKYRLDIQQQCLQKHKGELKEYNLSQLQKKLVWDNYRQNFETILDRKALKSDVDSSKRSIRNNLVPGAPICC